VRVPPLAPARPLRPARRLGRRPSWSPLPTRQTREWLWAPEGEGGAPLREPPQQDCLELWAPLRVSPLSPRTDRRSGFPPRVEHHIACRRSPSATNPPIRDYARNSKQPGGKRCEARRTRARAHERSLHRAPHDTAVMVEEQAMISAPCDGFDRIARPNVGVERWLNRCSFLLVATSHPLPCHVACGGPLRRASSDREKEAVHPRGETRGAKGTNRAATACHVRWGPTMTLVRGVSDSSPG
jgi:hypothetical protein